MIRKSVVDICFIPRASVGVYIYPVAGPWVHILVGDIILYYVLMVLMQGLILPGISVSSGTGRTSKVLWLRASAGAAHTDYWRGQAGFVRLTTTTHGIVTIVRSIWIIHPFHPLLHADYFGQLSVGRE